MRKIFFILFAVMLFAGCSHSSMQTEQKTAPEEFGVAEPPAGDADEQPGSKPGAEPSSPEVKKDETTVSFVTFGDWGTGEEKQKKVAETIGTYCKTEKCEFIVTLGDNFQGPKGVDSVNDPQWQTMYRDVYSKLGLPFYPSLGNHDYYGNEQAEVDYSKIDDSWRMPAFNYTLSVPKEDPIVEFFILFSGDSYIQAKESAWLKENIEKSKAKWKILISHYPIMSNGDDHGDSSKTNITTPILNAACNKFDLILSGHDHIFSYLVDTIDGCKVEQMVIGTGGFDAYGIKDDPRAIKSASINGFGWFEATKDKLKFKMIETGGKVFYEKEWDAKK